ncbi:hypothetical protein [Paenibacillus sp. 1P07SE]|uniref:hypothetical protein n=1 Tax=Paenibacillus sp. 1P07SE TaxID=3132209 RepID=UPI0039A4F4A8
MVRRWTGKLGRGVMLLLLAAGLFIGTSIGSSASAMTWFHNGLTGYQAVWHAITQDGMLGEEHLKGTGIYVGMADPHTIEVRVDGEAQSFQVGDDLRETVEALEEDDVVVFEYTEEHLDEIAILRTLLSIEAVEQE